MMIDWLPTFAAMTVAAAILGGCQVNEAPAPAESAANSAAPATASAEVPLAKTAADPGLQWGPCPDVFPAGCEIAVLHGDPAQPNADAFLRVPAGYAIPPHTHSSEERMVLVTGRMQVKYQGHPETTLEAGSYAYGPAQLPHRAICAPGAACTLFIAFVGPVDVEPYEGAI